VDLTVVGAYIEKLRKKMNPVVLVVGQRRNVPSEIAPRKKTANYALIALLFPAIHFCKVINVCENVTYSSFILKFGVRGFAYNVEGG
jgi:hypothetical protein